MKIKSKYFEKYNENSVSGIFSQNLKTVCHFLHISVKFRQNLYTKYYISLFITFFSSSKFRRKIAKFIKMNEKWNFIFIPAKIWTVFLLKFWDMSGAKVWESCRSRNMLQNDYLVALVAVHTAENEPFNFV